MMGATYVGGDFHGNYGRLRKMLDEKVFEPGDRIILIGDVTPSRGEKSNEIVAIFYDVKDRGLPKAKLDETISEIIGREIILTDEAIFGPPGPIDSGTFLKALSESDDTYKRVLEDEMEAGLEKLYALTRELHELGVTVILVTGNGETSIFDFNISNGVDKEVVPPPNERYFNKKALNGEFHMNGVYYIMNPILLGDETLLLPLEFIEELIELKSIRDLREDPRSELASIEQILQEKLPSEMLGRVRRIATHYPPLEALGGIKNRLASCDPSFGEYRENEVGLERMRTVSEIAARCPDLEVIFCGHVHKGTNDAEVELLPPSIEFSIELDIPNEYKKNVGPVSQQNTNEVRVCWTRPGHLCYWTAG